MTKSVAATLLCALVLVGRPAGAETINCTPVNAVPIVITLPGVYCFTHSFVTSITSGDAILIQANNVVIDLNGFRLGGLGAGLGTNAIGIRSVNQQNITIKNGTIRGFKFGINLFCPAPCTSQGHIVEDIRADQNTYVGMQVLGTGNIVRNNQVVATGGTTALGPDSNTYGIVISGFGSSAINNDVIMVTAVGAGTSSGIWVGTSAIANLVVNNRVTTADEGVRYGGTGKYRDNLTFNVTTPYTGGTDAGNNN